jgi:predicted DCC family thiol-disulfide oxidoreductase YuxK
VRWLQRRDDAGFIRATASTECNWTDRFELPLDDSVVLRDSSGHTFVRSSAVGAALATLPARWGAFGRVILWSNRVPAVRVVNDAGYRLIAKNRVAISRRMVQLGLLDASCVTPVSTTR